MTSTCLRLKQLLLSRWLAAPPALPALRLSSDSSSITAAFQYTPPTPYNAGDCFELQARACADRHCLACPLTRRGDCFRASPCAAFPDRAEAD
jgi:hypothetical protein